MLPWGLMLGWPGGRALGAEPPGTRSRKLGREEGELEEGEPEEFEPFGIPEGALGMPDGAPEGAPDAGMPGVVMPGVMWGLSPGPGCWMAPPMGWVVCTTQTPFCLASE